MTERKHTKLEDDYFAAEDVEKKRKLAHRVQKETEAAERARLKALHHMRCPKCGMQLQEVKYKGIHVDVCFSCNGIFLDRGDLEHIVRSEPHGVVEAILNWFKGETRA